MPALAMLSQKHLVMSIFTPITLDLLSRHGFVCLTSEATPAHDTSEMDEGCVPSVSFGDLHHPDNLPLIQDATSVENRRDPEVPWQTGWALRPPLRRSCCLACRFPHVVLSCCGCSTLHPDLQELVNAVSFPANLRSPQLGPMSLRMRCSGLFRSPTSRSSARSRASRASVHSVFGFSSRCSPRLLSVSRQHLGSSCRPLGTFLAAPRQVPVCFVPCRRPQSSCWPALHSRSWRTIRRIFRSCASWIAPRFLLHAFTVVCLSVSLLVLPSSHSACSRSSAASLRIRVALVTSLSANAS